VYHKHLETVKGAKALYDEAHKAAAAKRLAEVKVKQKLKKQQKAS
jgi:hypothetical protein